jgi:hypothetical protein
MDVATDYCAIRSELEDNACNLTAKLFELTQRLHRLVGKDHHEFLATRAACVKATNQLSESRNRLEEHRIRHGC